MPSTIVEDYEILKLTHNVRVFGAIRKLSVESSNVPVNGAFIKMNKIALTAVLLCNVFGGVSLAQAQPLNIFECQNCDLRGTDMGVREYLGRNLQNSQLAGADFRGADLSNVVFLGSDFAGADLRGTTLTNTFFTGDTNLQFADFRGAMMVGTFFTGASLRNADLRGATLIDGSLEETDLTGAKIEGLTLLNTFFCDTIMPDGTMRNDDCR